MAAKKQSEPVDFRELIRAEIERQGITTYRLEQETGYHRIHLDRWLAGEKAAIRSDVLARLLAALGVRVLPSRRGRRKPAE